MAKEMLDKTPHPSMNKVDLSGIKRQDRSVLDKAQEVFGTMRDATKEERDSVTFYVDSISVDTGINFFDI